jgi:hypothetical protein
MWFDFLVYSDPPKRDVDGNIVRSLVPVEYEYVPVGCGLERPISIATADTDPEGIKATYANVFAMFVKRASSYAHQAELLLRFDRCEIIDVRRALVAGKAHKHHPLLVADYRSRPSKRGGGRIDDMAAAYNVDRSTITRELRTAAKAGYIEWSELETRKRRG